ncbi:MAG TPA: protein-glutamate O-methyltransferase CheR [Rhizomicrobium sp.]|nr:protein-glutamate O-methyltransferase CheR [Rhizomicrobium sp.]
MGLAMRSEQAVAGEFAFTWADFRILAALVRAESGIVLSEAKANLVYSRLSKRVRARGLSSFGDYCGLVERDADERQALVAAMTTNVTRFFREPHHFDHLQGEVLPQLAARARRGERVRLWSSACSSGEEPYSIALALLAVMPDAGAHDILILASDLDPNMVAAGKAALYPAARRADIPRPLQGHHIEDHGAHVRMGEAVRALVRFRPLNLLKDWPMRGPFDAIFCRNVMIYFDQPTQDAIWARFAALLPPGAPLYIGHSERIASRDFALAGQTIYRRQP